MKIKPETKDKIVTAANTLLAEGVANPTNDQVREHLGGGSLSHIAPVMREWRESRTAEVAASLEMPSELKKVIETSVGQVWRAASNLASAEMEAVREKAKAEMEDVTNELNDAYTEIRRLEENVEALKKELAAKDATISQVQKQFDEARSQVSTFTSEKSALEAQVADKDEHIKALRAEKDEQINAIRAELKDARDDNKTLQGELVEIARKANKEE